MGVRGISGDGHRASRSEIPIADSPIAVRDRILLLSGPCSHVHDLGTRGTAGIDRAGFLRSEEHTSELQSLMRISYAVFCLIKKTIQRAIRHKITTQLRKLLIYLTKCNFLPLSQFY